MNIHTAWLISTLIAGAAFAQEPQPDSPQPVVNIDVGSGVSLDAIKAATWLQGAPPESFEPGKVYIFETWATWCGPCVRAIPHMNNLHTKYHEKGLRIYGMNVFENDQEKVAAFVKKKADEMTYPVAYTGKGSRFDKEWMKAAGVGGIPHSFVVMDGVIVLRGHPASLSEELIENLLKGGDEAKQAIAARLSMAGAQKSSAADVEFRNAVNNGDIPTMERLIADKEKQVPKSLFLNQMKAELMIARKQWPRIDAILVDPPTSLEQHLMTNSIANRLAMGKPDTADMPKELRAKVSSLYGRRITKKSRGNPLEWVTLSRLQFHAGETEAAQSSAQTALEQVKAMEAGGLPAAPFEKFAEEVNAGRMPPQDDFMKSLAAAMPKRPGKKAPAPK